MISRGTSVSFLRATAVPAGTAVSNNPPNCNDYSQIDLKFNSANIKMCESVKYLGVWIDDTLNWKVHIDYIYSKLTKFVGIFFINLVTSSPLIV